MWSGGCRAVKNKLNSSKRLRYQASGSGSFSNGRHFDRKWADLDLDGIRTREAMYVQRNRLISINNFNAQFLYSITICMLHYNPPHVSSINIPIFRRTNCIITASGIVTLCKRLYSTPDESSTLSLTSALDGRLGGQRHAPAALPPGNTRYPSYRRLGGLPEPFWTGAENLASTGIRSPDRPARRQLLYRLS